MLLLSVFKDAFLTIGVAIAASGRDQLWFCGAQTSPWGCPFLSSKLPELTQTGASDSIQSSIAGTRILNEHKKCL